MDEQRLQNIVLWIIAVLASTLMSTTWLLIVIIALLALCIPAFISLLIKKEFTRRSMLTTLLVLSPFILIRTFDFVNWAVNYSRIPSLTQFNSQNASGHSHQAVYVWDNKWNVPKDGMLLRFRIHNHRWAFPWDSKITFHIVHSVSENNVGRYHYASGPYRGKDAGMPGYSGDVYMDSVNYPEREIVKSRHLSFSPDSKGRETRPDFNKMIGYYISSL